MSQHKAEAIRLRLQKIITEWGQPVRLGRGSVWAANSTQARVSVMSNAIKYAWFRTSETTGWVSPAFVVTLAQDGTTEDFGEVEIGDVVELPLGTFTIRKIDRPRLSGVVFKTVLYAARDA